MTKEQYENKVSISPYLIAILVVVRIIFATNEQITDIVYMINVVSLLYVVATILHNSYEKISAGIKSNSKNKIIAKKNKKIKIKFVLGSLAVIVLSSILYVLIILFNWHTEIGVINDIIALIALLLSIEDEAIGVWIVKRYS